MGCGAGVQKLEEVEFVQTGSQACNVIRSDDGRFRVLSTWQVTPEKALPLDIYCRLNRRKYVMLSARFDKKAVPCVKARLLTVAQPTSITKLIGQLARHSIESFCLSPSHNPTWTLEGQREVREDDFGAACTHGHSQHLCKHCRGFRGSD